MGARLASEGGKPRARLLGVAAIVAWSINAFEAVATILDEGRWPSIPSIAVRFVPLAVFLPAVLWLLGPGLGSRPRAVTYGILSLASIASTFLNIELFYVLAVLLPFLLGEHRAMAWLVLCNVVGMPWLVFVLKIHPSNAGLDPRLSGAATTMIAVVSHLGWQAFAFAVGLMAAKERDQRRETAQLNLELVATQGLLADSARLTNRLEISRELHDTLGHHLTGLHLQLELVARLAPAQVRSPLEEARRIAKLLLADVRDAVSALRTDAVIDLRGALSTLAKSSSGPEIRLTFGESVRVERFDRAHALFRCAQEAITNAHRHASAGVVLIDVRETSSGVVLSVSDDGRGQKEARPGNGLRGMRERIEALDGHLDLETAEGRGFRVQAWLPRDGAT
ncbi:Two-component system sensor protein [Labilithrix luteola]|uniref:Two-component system sensor protein n=1 Tax=Labilithrix luteola TaxID=1391654 RepID=A0A0K1Q056_9BACT|nr:sensor histidine kinase [Labilithrix luteola]AKU99165.1 Two-component system sensor protein [Labilithrix luteola]